MWVLTYDFFCGNGLAQIKVTCLAWQYNTVLIGGKLPLKWHRTGAIPPQEKLSPVAHWGECRGGSAPSALSFPPLSLQRKRCPRWVSGPCGEHTKTPDWTGSEEIFQSELFSRGHQLQTLHQLSGRGGVLVPGLAADEAQHLIKTNLDLVGVGVAQGDVEP